MIQAPTKTTDLLAVTGLGVAYGDPAAPVRAVVDVDLTVGRGESVGIVGESGSGKSTLLRALLGLHGSGAAVSGGIAVDGVQLAHDPAAMRRVRGGTVSMVFQDPVNAFNPAYTLGSQLGRLVALHRPELGREQRRAHVAAMLDRVGIPAHRTRSHPFEFSQGQLQRCMIAAAFLAGRPALVLADEPTTSLDVTVEAQIVELIRDLRAELGMSMVLVTHNLGLVADLCDRVHVMYAGRFVEHTTIRGLFDSPAHPYTRALLKSAPDLDRVRESRGSRLPTMRGGVPDLAAPPPGCPFAPRCDEHLGEVCDRDLPELLPVPLMPAARTAHGTAPAGQASDTLPRPGDVRARCHRHAASALSGGTAVEGVKA
ncbi:ABC transporter ATP-binding protein [Yinghuangia soli]|uniref:ABC transporter ATP-binding protein n=1 Tax=Yinghuangia soli TaxID=2908204 RepID=A0AA41Q4P8_9ACTN|nr:ABC transporter ATP-binding protein [Yinghuangia soli]MCF2531503.1 ABC transporter ATP-binding protein [Yinghuangia soli]